MYHYATRSLILPRIATPIRYRYLGKIQILFLRKQNSTVFGDDKVGIHAVSSKFYNILQWIIRLILEGLSMHSLGCTKFSIRIKANRIAIGINVMRLKEKYERSTLMENFGADRLLDSFRTQTVIGFTNFILLTEKIKLSSASYIKMSRFSKTLYQGRFILSYTEPLALIFQNRRTKWEFKSYKTFLFARVKLADEAEILQPLRYSAQIFVITFHQIVFVLIVAVCQRVLKGVVCQEGCSKH